MAFKTFLILAFFIVTANHIRAENLSVMVDGYRQDPAKEIRLTLSDKAVVITVTFDGQQKASDALNKIEANLCGNVNNNVNGGRTTLFYFGDQAPYSFPSGSGYAKGNILTYSFNPSKLTNCRNNNFYLFLSFAKSTGIKPRLLRFYLANEKRPGNQPAQSQQQSR